MNRRSMPFSATAISPCKCCGRIVDINAVEPICIMERAGGKPPVIIYRCLCHNTRVIPLVTGTWKDKGEGQDSE